MLSFGCERTVVTAADTGRRGGGGARCQSLSPLRRSVRGNSRGCISFPLADVLCSNSKLLASCHSLCLYSWIQSECFRDFPSKQRWGFDAGNLSTLIKVCPSCLFSSKPLLSKETYSWHDCMRLLISSFSNDCFTCRGGGGGSRTQLFPKTPSLINNEEVQQPLWMAEGGGGRFSIRAGAFQRSLGKRGQRGPTMKFWAKTWLNGVWLGCCCSLLYIANHRLLGHSHKK